MMAQDPILPSRGRLSSGTREVLERALATYARDGKDDGEIARALGAVSAEARERAIPPEEVLVELKSLWSTLPAVTTRGVVGEETRMLQRIVTMCIKAYYR